MSAGGEAAKKKLGHADATGRFAPAAEYYASIAWSVFPVYGIINGKCACNNAEAHPKGPRDYGKKPYGRMVHHGHLDATTDAEQLRKWWTQDPEANLGVNCERSGFIVVDVDPQHNGHESWLKLEDNLAAEGVTMPETVEAITGQYREGRGRHLFYRVQDGEDLKPNLSHMQLPGVDVKHKGYVVLNPSRHHSGLIYEWKPGHAPWERKMAAAPEEFLRLIRKRGRRLPPSEGGTEYGTFEWGGEKVDVDSILAAGIHEGERTVTIYKIACAMCNDYPTSALGKNHIQVNIKQLFRAINSKHVFPPLDTDELDFQVQRAIDFIKDNPKGSAATRALGPGLMDWVKRQDEPGGVRPVEKPEPATSGAGSGVGDGAGGRPGIASGAMPSDPRDALPPDADEWGNDAEEPDVDEHGVPRVIRRTLTDRGNARRLVDYYHGEIRYTEGMGWFIWNGEYWEPDAEALGVLEKSQVVYRIIASELAGLSPGDDEWKRVISWATQSKNTGKLKSAIEQWKADSRMTRVSVESWDHNPHYLGVRNGVIDLRTGVLLDGTLDMGITKRTDVAYAPGMRNIRWEEFLNFATGGDREFQGWLQKAAGYTLTGLRHHDVLFMVFGQPGSGKSTFLEALGHALGKGYMTAMNSSVLVDDGMKSSSDEYHWASLRGKRMVVFSEWPQGKRTKEDAVKRLTGDMTIQARNPHERPFNFESQAKLWIGTNSLPWIQEEAMWRRIRAIPFPYVPSSPDPSLKDYLMDPDGGLPAVLSWAVEGAVRLLNSSDRDSLGWCAAVRDASAEYRRSEDRMGIFLEEETEVAVGTSVPVKVLHDVHRMWAEDRGENAMSATPFRKALEERGLRVDGIGRRAILHDRRLLPRIAEAPGGTPDWSDLARFAR